MSADLGGCSRLFKTLALCAVFVLVAASCSDDDEGEGDVASTDTSTTLSGEQSNDVTTNDATTTAAEAADENNNDGTDDDTDASATDATQTTDPFCTAGPAVDAALAPQEPDPATVEAALTAADEAAPDAIAESVTTATGVIREILQTGNTDLFESEELAAATQEIFGYYVSDCGFNELSLTAGDYRYDGVRANVDPGNAVLRLSNEGSEFHEAFVFRISDDVDLPVTELFALPEEEVRTMITEVGGAGFTAPGDEELAPVNLEQPGRYAVVCFIPVGATLEAAEEFEASGVEPDGPPHFTEGMLAEFEVA